MPIRASEFLRRLWHLLNRRRLERELAEEMAAHREMMREAGRENFGSALRLHETTRDIWGWTSLDRLFQDLVYGLRVLRKSPAFTLTAMLVLALGIGVNLTAFRIILLETTPAGVRDPGSLVELDRWFPNGHGNTMAYPVLAFYAAHARSFRAVMASHEENAVFGESLAGEDPDTIAVEFVTANYFAEQGDPAAYGRVLTHAIDEDPAAEPAALLSQRFWENRFGGNAAIVGQRVRLNGKPVRVVGILRNPREQRTAVWMPIAKLPYIVEGSKLLTDWTSAQLHGTARLNPGVSRQAAEEESRALAAAIREIRPDAVAKDERLALVPFNSFRLHPDEITPVVAAVTLVALILVVACANLGTLLLARGVTREREIYARMALGATRTRVVRQLVTESALLAALSSVAAFFLSNIAIHLLQTRAGGPEWDALDWRVMAATAGIALLATAVFGIAPALRLTNAAPHGGRARSTFLAGQVGASCILLMLAGLLVRGFDRLQNTDAGFDYQKIVCISPGLHAHGYASSGAKQYLAALRERLLASPGVESVSVMWLAPWGNQSSGYTERSRSVNIDRIDADFLKTLGVKLVRGRNLQPGEAGVALVSESFARWRWPGEDPIGKSLDKPDALTVAGIVKTAGTFRIREEDPLGVYYPLTAQDYADATLAVRVAGEPAKYAGGLIAAARSIDPKLRPGYDLPQRRYDDSIRQTRQLATAVSLLGILATLIAAIGLAGLTGYTVGQRTREIGVRMALGARAPQVIHSVLQPMRFPIVIGLAAGMFGAAAISSVLRNRIFGLRPLDPVAYFAAIALFAAIAALAALPPARRAIRIKPAEALRHE